MKTFKYFLYALGLSVFFLTTQPASAFEIAPVKSLLTVNPGTSQTVVVKIKNTEKNNLEFKLLVLGMLQDENGKPVFFRGGDIAENWIYPESNAVKIKANETKSVNFIVKIPAEALPGSHYLGLAVEPVLVNDSQVGVNTRLVSMLTLQVTGQVRESVVVEKWMPLDNITGLNNWKFDLSFKNNGTVEVLLGGSVTIKNWKGEEVSSEPLVLGNKFLAGSKRVLHPEIVLRNRINLPGLYQAQVKINYGLTNQTATAIAYIWYFPMWSKVGLILVMLLVAGLIFWKVKK